MVHKITRTGAKFSDKTSAKNQESLKDNSHKHLQFEDCLAAMI